MTEKELAKKIKQDLVRIYNREREGETVLDDPDIISLVMSVETLADLLLKQGD